MPAPKTSGRRSSGAVKFQTDVSAEQAVTLDGKRRPGESRSALTLRALLTLPASVEPDGT